MNVFDPSLQIPPQPLESTIRDGFAFAVAGDIIGPFRPLVPLADPGLEAVCAILRGADVTMANHEGSAFDIDEFDGYRAAEHGGGYPLTAAVVAADLKAMGIDVLSKANNHATDWGVEGLLETRRVLSAAGVVHAGSGPSKSAARAPAYLETPKGRVAVVSAASTFTPMSEAGDAAGEIGPRPGISVLRTTAVALLPPAEMDALYQIASTLQIGPWVDSHVRGTPDRVTIGTQTFARADRAGISYEMNQQDQSEILRAIRTSKQMSDFVAFTLHGHESLSGLGEDRRPADFHRALFHQAIDSGADLVSTTGPHTLRGIEIYRGKPVFYGLGSLFLELEDDRGPSVELARARQIDPIKYTAAEYIQSMLKLPDDWYDGLIPVTYFEQGVVRAIHLYPLTLQRKTGYRLEGAPRRAGEVDAHRILTRFAELCAPFGTVVEIVAGVGVITLK